MKVYREVRTASVDPRMLVEMGYSLPLVCMGWKMACMGPVAHIGKMTRSDSYSPVIAGIRPGTQAGAPVHYMTRGELGLQETLYIREARVVGHRRRWESSLAIETSLRSLNATDPDMLL